MRFKAFDSTLGSHIIFFKEEYPEEDLYKAIAESKASYTQLVFYNKAAAREAGTLIKEFPFKGKERNTIRVHLIDCVDNELIELLLDLKREHMILEIYVSMPDVYKVIEQSGIKPGIEIWDDWGKPDALRFCDIVINDVSKIKELTPYVEQVVEDLLKYHPQNDLETILLLDIWMQRYIQYIKGKESVGKEGIYICDDLDRDSNLTDVLLHHFGRCEDIAFTAALILNHPRIGMFCRQVSVVREDGFNHSWNMVRCNGKEYYIDFTHNITRNPQKVSNALKAESYSNLFTLLGKKDAEKKYGFPVGYSAENISSTSFDKKTICDAITRLQKREGIKLSWQEPLSYVSRLVKQHI